MNSGTWIEIDAAALRHNVDALNHILGETELCMVVKGNAYGHGYAPIVTVAEAHGHRSFAVFSAREARNFVAASDGHSRLQVMGTAEPQNLQWLVDQGIEFWLNAKEDWPIVKALSGQPKLHMELETGMNRSGIEPDDALAIAEELHARGWELAGTCTHLAGAEDPTNDERIEAQLERFQSFVGEMAARGIPTGQRHAASSAAALRLPSSRMDLVRIGIACYGLWPSPHVRRLVYGEPPDLRNVLTWKSRLMSCRDVADGENVGYGESYEAEGDMRIGLVAVGYGDGLSRGLSNQGHVLVRGKRASIIGPVNMNMIQIHIGHIPGVASGDEVMLIGRQGNRDISVASFTEFNRIVNYELMARLSWEVPRIVVDEDKPGPSFGE